MGAELDEPLISEATRAASFTNERGVENKIRFLKNISGLWLVQETRRDFAKRGQEYDYAALTDMAANAEAFRTLVDPNHGPFGSPDDMPAKIDAFAKSTNQPTPEDAGQYVRCCLESLALTYRNVLEGLESLLPRATIGSKIELPPISALPPNTASIATAPWLTGDQVTARFSSANQPLSRATIIGV
jgi:rhamnulokinase